MGEQPMKFLSDAPVKIDKLGTHASIAKLLVDIVHSESDNPLVVGLFGSWGTGKSSIAMMYDDLVKEKQILIIFISMFGIL